MAYLFKKFRKPKTLLEVIQGKRKHHPPSEYKRAHALLVTVFSWYIRTRETHRSGKCFICGTGPIQDCYHFIPCGNGSIRFEPDNACGGCKKCNYSEFMNRGTANCDDRVRAAHVRMVGEERVQQLEAMRHAPFKKSAAELRDLVAHFKELLARGDWK